jgi:hypothetical protein
MTWEELNAALPNARPETQVQLVDADGGAYELAAAEIEINDEGAVVAAKLTVTKL